MTDSFNINYSGLSKRNNLSLEEQILSCLKMQNWSSIQLTILLQRQPRDICEALRKMEASGYIRIATTKRVNVWQLSKLQKLKILEPGRRQKTI